MLITLLKTALICPLSGLVIVIALCNGLLALHVAVLTWLYSDPHAKLLKHKLLYATSISEYAAVAVELDRCLGLETWKKEAKSTAYDLHRIQLWEKSLTAYGEGQAVERICEVLLQAQKANHGGAFSPDVYSYTFWNTKDALIEYGKLIVEALEYLTECVIGSETPSLKVYSFVTQVSALWGKCALILEGERSAMYYHYGVCQGLLLLRCVPDVIYARETNALLAAWLVLHADSSAIDDPFHTRQEEILTALKLFKSPQKWYCLSFTQRKTILSVLSVLYGHVTMLDAYNLTGRQLNLICKRCDQYFVLNYKTTPDVSVTSAVLACMCEDVLQPAGGGALYPLFAGNSKMRDSYTAPGGLWGLVISEECWSAVFLPPALRVGNPYDTLSGTAGRDLLAAAQSVRSLLRDLLKQLGSLLLQTAPRQHGSLSLGHSACSHAIPNNSLSGLFCKWCCDSCEGISDLLTPMRNRIILAPQRSMFHTRRQQIARGVATSFRHACLMKTRSDIERAIRALADAVAQNEHGGC